MTDFTNQETDREVRDKNRETNMASVRYIVGQLMDETGMDQQFMTAALYNYLSYSVYSMKANGPEIPVLAPQAMIQPMAVTINPPDKLSPFSEGWFELDRYYFSPRIHTKGYHVRNNWVGAYVNDRCEGQIMLYFLADIHSLPASTEDPCASKHVHFVLYIGLRDSHLMAVRDLAVLKNFSFPVFVPGKRKNEVPYIHRRSTGFKVYHGQFLNMDQVKEIWELLHKIRERPLYTEEMERPMMESDPENESEREDDVEDLGMDEF
jgi:hypothetical protein